MVPSVFVKLTLSFPLAELPEMRPVTVIVVLGAETGTEWARLARNGSLLWHDPTGGWLGGGRRGEVPERMSSPAES